MLATMIVAAPIGGSVLRTVGVATAYVVATGVGIPLNYYFLGRATNIRFTELLRRVWRSLLSAAGMLTILSVFYRPPLPETAMNAIHSLAIRVAIGAVVYAGL